MIRFLVLGTVLGLFSGFVPGPFSALIATTGLRRGFRAALGIAVVPIVTETTVMLIAALVLSQLPEDALRWMGVLGGFLIFYLAWRTWRASRQPPDQEQDSEEIQDKVQRLGQGALLAVLSPAPWAFWLLVGAPILLGAWRVGWGAALLFYGSFLLFLIGTHLVLAATAARGGKKLSPAWHRRIMRGAAAALVLGGGVLLWQSYRGNFHQMVQGSQTIENVVDDTVPRER
jgi:threonine/homoserine/homoserine lactone efflux protein